jgi:hypothetical protein
MVQNADVSGNAAERDLVLAEPALYNADTGSYNSMPLQYLYIPGKQLSIVGSFNLPTDKRTSEIGKDIFGKDNFHAEQSEAKQRTAAHSYTTATTSGISAAPQADKLADDASASSAGA